MGRYLRNSTKEIGRDDSAVIGLSGAIVAATERIDYYIKFRTKKPSAKWCLDLSEALSNSCSGVLICKAQEHPVGAPTSQHQP